VGVAVASQAQSLDDKSQVEEACPNIEKVKQVEA
jgi:hypothetical protein